MLCDWAAHGQVHKEANVTHTVGVRDEMWLRCICMNLLDAGTPLAFVLFCETRQCAHILLYA